MFLPSEVYLRTYQLQAAVGVLRATNAVDALEPCDDYSAMKIAIKFSCSLNKDVVSSCTRHLLHQLGEACRAGWPVALDLGIGVLSSKDRTLSFQFKPAYLVHWTPAAAAAPQHQPQLTQHLRRQQMLQLQLPGDEPVKPKPAQGGGSNRPPGLRLAGELKADGQPVSSPAQDAEQQEAIAEPEHVATGMGAAASPGRPHNKASPGCDGALPASLAARPAWGVRIPPPSPRRATPASPRVRAATALAWQHTHGQQQGGIGVASPGRAPPSPGRDGRAPHPWEEVDGASDGRSCDSATVEAVVDVLPVARTIQLAARTRRARPTSPPPFASGRHTHPAGPGTAAALRPRPASAPRCRRTAPEHGAQEATRAVLPSAASVRAAEPGSPEAGPPYVLPVYTDEGGREFLQAEELPSRAGAGGKGVAGSAGSAGRRPPASPRSGIEQRPAWGAGRGAQLRSQAGPGAVEHARPVSAPRLRSGLGPRARPVTGDAPGEGGVAACGAGAAAALQVGAERPAADGQPAWLQSAWMSSGSDTNQLWSPDGKPAAVARGTCRGGAWQQEAASPGRAAPVRDVRRAGGPAVSPWQPQERRQMQDVQQPDSREGVRPSDDIWEGSDDADAGVGSRLVSGCQERARDTQRGTRKPLFLTPQKANPVPSSGAIRMQQAGVKQLAQPQRQMPPNDKAGTGAGLPGGAGMAGQRAHDQDRDSAPKRQLRDQLSKGAAAAFPSRASRPAQPLATVRALSPGRDAPLYNVRYGTDQGPCRPTAVDAAECVVEQSQLAGGRRPDAQLDSSPDAADARTASHGDSTRLWNRDAETGPSRFVTAIPSGASRDLFGSRAGSIAGRLLGEKSSRVETPELTAPGLLHRALVPRTAGPVPQHEGPERAKAPPQEGAAGPSDGGTSSPGDHTSSGGCADDWSSWGGLPSGRSSAHGGDGYPLPLCCSSSESAGSLAPRASLGSSGVLLGAHLLVAAGMGREAQGAKPGYCGMPKHGAHGEWPQPRRAAGGALCDIREHDAPRLTWRLSGI